MVQAYESLSLNSRHPRLPFQDGPHLVIKIVRRLLGNSLLVLRSHVSVSPFLQELVPKCGLAAVMNKDPQNFNHAKILMSPESTKYLREMGDQFLTVAVLEIAYKVYLAMVLPNPTTTPLDRIGHLCGALFFIRIWKGWIDEAATLVHFKGDRWAFCVTREAAKALEINCHSLLLPSAIASETICLASHGNGAHSGLSRFSDSRDVLMEHCQR